MISQRWDAHWGAKQVSRPLFKGLEGHRRAQAEAASGAGAGAAAAEVAAAAAAPGLAGNANTAAEPPPPQPPPALSTAPKGCCGAEGHLPCQGSAGHNDDGGLSDPTGREELLVRLSRSVMAEVESALTNNRSLATCQGALRSCLNSRTASPYYYFCQTEIDYDDVNILLSQLGPADFM